MRTSAAFLVSFTLLLPVPLRAASASGDRFELADAFQLEWASDPRIAPDGGRVVFVRNGFDAMTDRPIANLWVIDTDGTNLRPLTSGNQGYGSPRWSPDGGRLLFVAGTEGSHQLFVRWMDTGQQTELTRLERAPKSPSWSPDGKWIAFQMFVPEEPPKVAEMPEKHRRAAGGSP